MSTSQAWNAKRVAPALLIALVTAAVLVWAAGGRSANVATTIDSEVAVVRVYYDSIRDVERLSSYDVWEFNNTAERYVLAAVDRDAYASLQAAGWRIALDPNATASLQQPRAKDLFYGDYRTVDELHVDLDSYNSTYPSLVEVVTYGESECQLAGGCTTPGGDTLAGYELRAIRITNEGTPGTSVVGAEGVTRGDKPVLFLIANIHSREITTPELAMRLADWLLTEYGNNADATWLVDSHEIWIVPTANPDGHWIVELGTTPNYNHNPFSHRKNANQDANGDGTADCSIWPSSSGGQFGVDLNRNHSFGWGSSGSSGIPCDLTYRGPAPTSESEVASLQDLVAALIPDQRGEDINDAAPDDTQGIFITVHSYSELVLWPWGYLYERAPNYTGLKAIGDKLASFNGYLSCQPTECLYAASGASDDWAYGELGIPAFTFEVGTSFMPPYSVIDALQWPENKPAFIYAARIARSPYLTVLGPDSHEATITRGGGSATVEVTLDDTATGDSFIAAGEYSIDRPFWDATHTAIPLVALDGAFDSPNEVATAELDVSGLSMGRHIVYFRGQDSDGNWGAVTAAFVEVGPEMPQAYLPHIIRP